MERERKGGGKGEIILREESSGQIKYNMLPHQECGLETNNCDLHRPLISTQDHIAF